MGQYINSGFKMLYMILCIAFFSSFGTSFERRKAQWSNMLVLLQLWNKRVQRQLQSKCTKTAVKKSVTPRMTSRRSTSTTSSSRHSTPHHSDSDDYISPRNPTHSTHRERGTRSSASPGISILNIVELDLCCSQVHLSQLLHREMTIYLVEGLIPR